jgi:hypothetical protein
MIKMTKGNDGTGNTILRDDWQTPKWLFDKLNKRYEFSFDCCATKENTKCEDFSSDFKEEYEYKHRAWMNPPFSKAYEMFELFFKKVKSGIAIYRCDNLETKIWQDVIFKNASWIWIPRGRINYEGKTGKGSRFPSALIGFNIIPPSDLLSDEGVFLKVN